MTAVCPVVIKGNGLWVGWPGIHLDKPIENIPESDPNDKTPTAGLKSDQVRHFYSKQIDMQGMRFSDTVANRPAVSKSNKLEPVPNDIIDHFDYIRLYTYYQIHCSIINNHSI